MCIGQLYGNVMQCRKLWELLETKMGRKELEETTVVFLGNYCDVGPATCGVLDWLMQLQQTREQGRTRFLMGAHDHGLAAFLQHLTNELGLDALDEHSVYPFSAPTDLTPKQEEHMVRMIAQYVGHESSV